MNRRDFLLFRTTGGKRVVELSCERLYMRSLDAQWTKPSSQFDIWNDDPLCVPDKPAVEELFRDLEGDLRGADVVRVIEMHWLASDDLKQRLEAILDRFRTSGGQVLTT